MHELKNLMRQYPLLYESRKRRPPSISNFNLILSVLRSMDQVTILQVLHEPPCKSNILARRTPLCETAALS